MRERDIIRRVTELGRRRGFVTFDQINELLPPARTAPEVIERLFEALNREGINLTDD
jgi:RNA polymerase primary sigma factor